MERLQSGWFPIESVSCGSRGSCPLDLMLMWGCSLWGGDIWSERWVEESKTFPVSASPSSFNPPNCIFFLSFGQCKYTGLFSFLSEKGKFKGYIEGTLDFTFLLWFEGFPNETDCLDRIYSNLKKELFKVVGIIVLTILCFWLRTVLPSVLYDRRDWMDHFKIYDYILVNIINCADT